MLLFEPGQAATIDWLVWGRLRAGLAQLVEQLFRKQQVPGSSPGVGSGPRMAGAQQAEVAEPADALRSGRSEGNLVGVQISPSAPRTLVG